MHPKLIGWKRKVVDEMVEFYLNFVYLAFFLVAFSWYRRLILAEYDILYLSYWMPLVEAAILAKVIMIGDLLPFGRGLERKPLIVPTFFRTALFGVYVGVFSVLERTIRELLHGKGLSAGLADLASKGRNELLAQCLIMACAFVPFFAFKELEGVLGKDKLRELFWSRGVTTAPEGERV